MVHRSITTFFLILSPHKPTPMSTDIVCRHEGPSRCGKSERKEGHFPPQKQKNGAVGPWGARAAGLGRSRRAHFRRSLDLHRTGLDALAALFPGVGETEGKAVCSYTLTGHRHATMHSRQPYRKIVAPTRYFAESPKPHTRQ